MLRDTDKNSVSILVIGKRSEKLYGSRKDTSAGQNSKSVSIEIPRNLR